VNTISSNPCRFAWALWLLVLSAAVQSGANAQEQPNRPFIMEHKTRARFVEPHPEQNGKWDTLPFHMPINPVHIAMMHTGKVLIVSGSGNDPDNTNLQAAVWDPKSLTVRTFKISWDMFCNGMVILSDGKPFVFGGTLKYDTALPAGPFLGETKTASFDTATETFTDTPIMGANQGRWYPSGIVLSDSSVLVYSGLNTDGTLNKSVQIWDGATWAAGGTVFNSVQLYPRQHLLPDGRVFVSGANPDSQMYDPTTKNFAFVVNTNYNQNRQYGTSVLLPLTPENKFNPKVIIMGGSPNPGNVPGTDTTELIDLSVPMPKWVAGPAMLKGRIQMNATILPNGKVLASGGSVNNEDNATAVKEAQLYDPSNNAFSAASVMGFPRLYHSNTMLLPDATVLALGGNPVRKTYQQEVEIYSPPYLFKPDGSLAKRPTITGVAPGELHYGEQFIVTTPDADKIKSVVLIRAGAVTHSFDMDQRLVGLNFVPVAGVLQAKAPANGNLAPPGYYLLFILNTDGVPSVAQFVHLTDLKKPDPKKPDPKTPKIMKLTPTSSPAPSLKLPDGSGVIRDLADSRKRNVALVFFQGDCIHCADQLRNLVREARELNYRGVEILAVSSHKVADPAAALRALGVVESDRFQLLIDEDHHAFRDFGCYKSAPLHALFLIDGEGVIRASYIGESPFGETKDALQRLRDLSPRR